MHVLKISASAFKSVFQYAFSAKNMISEDLASPEFTGLIEIRSGHRILIHEVHCHFPGRSVIAGDLVSVALGSTKLHPGFSRVRTYSAEEKYVS